MGYVYHILSVMLLSVAPLLNKLATETLSPTLAALANSMTGAVLGILLTINNRAEWHKALRSKRLFISGCANALGLIFLFTALSIEQPTTVALLGRLYIPMSSFLAFFIIKEKIDRVGGIILIFSFIGMLLFSWSPNIGLQLGAGFYYSLGFAFLFALTNIYGKLAECEPWITVTYNHAFAVIVLCLFIIFTDIEIFNQAMLKQGQKAILISSAAGFFGGFLGLGFFFKGLQTVPVFESNLFRCAGPLFVFIVSYKFYPLSWSTPKVLGATITICATVLFALHKAKPQLLIKSVKN